MHSLAGAVGAGVVEASRTGMSKTAELWNSYTADTSKKNRFMSRMFVHCVRLVLGTHCGRLVPWCTKRSFVPLSLIHI